MQHYKSLKHKIMKKLILLFSLVVITCFLANASIPIKITTIYYVDADASGNNNGSNWADAYIYLQDAISAASNGDQIWVANGTYYPDDGAGYTDTFRVCVDGYPTGLDLPAGNQLKVNMYPNPTRDKVTIELNGTVPGAKVELTVLNIAGQQVLSKTFSTAEQISFSMANHVSGLYFVQLGLKDKRITKKLIPDRKQTGICHRILPKKDGGI
jgi:hypothetical protein